MSHDSEILSIINSFTHFDVSVSNVQSLTLETLAMGLNGLTWFVRSFKPIANLSNAGSPFSAKFCIGYTMCKSIIDLLSDMQHSTPWTA